MFLALKAAMLCILNIAAYAMLASVILASIFCMLILCLFALYRLKGGTHNIVWFVRTRIIK